MQISSLGQDCTGEKRFKNTFRPSEECTVGMETADQLTCKDCQCTDLEEKKQEDVAKVTYSINDSIDIYYNYG